MHRRRLKIDWVSLDNDMLEIRTRGLASRRLASPGKGAQMTIETLAYVIPIVLLIGLALNTYWRRKNTVPMVGPAGSAGPGSAGASAGSRSSVRPKPCRRSSARSRYATSARTREGSRESVRVQIS